MEKFIDEIIIDPGQAGESPTSTETIGKFINLMTDFGFKRAFGSEPHIDLLKAFLNALFQGKKQITDLTFNKTENQGPVAEFRITICDLTCTCQNGEQFMIEVQRVSQPFFKDRAIYYTSAAIHSQGLKGCGWKYQLKEVYMIGLMGFCFPDSPPEQWLHRVHLTEETTGKVFYEKLGYIFVELPKFNKQEGELTNDLDLWLYALKNMHNLEEIPVPLEKPVFEKLFKIAEVSNLSKEEYMMYEKSLKAFRDEYAILEGAKDEGRAEGEEKGSMNAKKEMVKNLLNEREFTISKIARLANVTEEFVLGVMKSIN